MTATKVLIVEDDAVLLRGPAFPETANQPAQAKAPSPLRSAGALQDADAPTPASL